MLGQAGERANDTRASIRATFGPIPASHWTKSALTPL
jgi:hypothetical protein